MARNVDLGVGEDQSAVTALIQDSSHAVYPLTVEYVGKVPDFHWLTQVNVILPDQLVAGDAWVRVFFHGFSSNWAPIKIKASP